MALALPSFSLTPFWKKEQLLLVRAVDAVRLCREGTYEKLPGPRPSPSLLADARKCPAEARDFIHKANLHAVSLAGCNDMRVFEQLGNLLEGGTLVVVREGERSATDETPSLMNQRRVIRAIAQMKHAVLGFEGRTYRLVAGADLGKVPDRETYTVVERSEGMRVLKELGKQASPGKAAPILEAGNQLTRDWRPPLSPDGLVLLKKTVVRQNSPKSEAPAGKPKSPGEQAAVAAPEKEEVACRPCAALREAEQAEILIQASQTGAPFCEECGPPS